MKYKILYFLWIQAWSVYLWDFMKVDNWWYENVVRRLHDALIKASPS